MDKVTKLAKTVRTNWKKSLFGVIAFSYASIKAKEKYDIHLLMQAACKEALTFGEDLIPMDRNPTVITVILNPVANKRRAKQDFQKYCEPLLHLAGLEVDIIQTTAEGSAKEIVENLKGTEAIIIAGGDGTLSEAVTGLLRRNDNANQFPLGVLPLGRTNSLGNTMFPGGTGADKVKQLIDASMAIIKGQTVWKDAMKIEPIPEADETPNRPVYAMSAIHWGAFRDTLAKRDKYWIYGSLRDYAAFVFNGYKDTITWNCSGTIKYTAPCTGCNNCIKRPDVKSRRWAFFVQNTQAQPQKQEAINPECARVQELCFKTNDFKILTRNIENNDIPALKILIGKNMHYSYTQFVSEGWRRVKDKTSNDQIIPVRTVELLPNDPGKDVVIEIDKEEFDLKPVKITVLPNMIRLFCNSQTEKIDDMNSTSLVKGK